MPIRSTIKDGKGSSNEAEVTLDKSLRVTSFPPSPAVMKESGFLDILKERHILIDTLKNSSGSEGLDVDGSTNSQDFYIESENDKVKQIDYVKFIIEDKKLQISSGEASRFGDAYATGLTNGIRMFAYTSGSEDDIFFEPIKALGDFYRFSESIVNDTDVTVDNTDVFVAKIDFPAPLTIIPASFDKLVVRIQDDLTATYRFNVIAYGSLWHL